MSPAKSAYPSSDVAKPSAVKEEQVGHGLIGKLMDEIATADVFTAARTLRERNAFTRD